MCGCEKNKILCRIRAFVEEGIEIGGMGPSSEAQVAVRKSVRGPSRIDPLCSSEPSIRGRAERMS